MSEDAARNWRFILYVFSLFVVMIYAAHSADQKVVRIDQLNKELQGLRNEHIEGRRAVQQSRLESSRIIDVLVVHFILPVLSMKSGTGIYLFIL